MKNETRNVVKQVMVKLQEAIDLLEKVEGENEEVDTLKEDLGYSFADLEYEVNG